MKRFEIEIYIEDENVASESVEYNVQPGEKVIFSDLISFGQVSISARDIDLDWLLPSDWNIEIAGVDVDVKRYLYDIEDYFEGIRHEFAAKVKDVLVDNFSDEEVIEGRNYIATVENSIEVAITVTEELLEEDFRDGELDWVDESDEED